MKKLRDSFTVFVLSHRRPDDIKTLDLLDEVNYSGDSYVVVDDEDPKLDAYRDRFGDRLLVFSKDEMEERFDRADNFNDQTSSSYPRMATWEFAEEMGYDWFMQLDDDYEWFGHRIDADGNYSDGIPFSNFDAVVESLIEYMEQAPIHSMAMSQGGDWIGGENSTNAGVTTKRKVMNSFLCHTGRPYAMKGRLNEDVNTYVTEGLRGKIFLTVMPLFLTQETTQTGKGGMTDAYLEAGTYVKSFYTIMHAPACVSITKMGTANPRLHHQVSWRHTAPKILHEKHRKPDQ